MDIFELVGIKHVKGNYNNVAYDFYNFYCIDKTDIDGQVGVGNMTTVFKVRQNELGNWLQGHEPADLVGRKFNAIWGRYQDQIQKPEWMSSKK